MVTDSTIELESSIWKNISIWKVFHSCVFVRLISFSCIYSYLLFCKKESILIGVTDQIQVFLTKHIPLPMIGSVRLARFMRMSNWL